LDEAVIIAGINLVRLAIQARESGHKLVVIVQKQTVISEVFGI
jgi:hypothetical protein